MQDPGGVLMAWAVSPGVVQMRGTGMADGAGHGSVAPPLTVRFRRAIEGVRRGREGILASPPAAASTTDGPDRPEAAAAMALVQANPCAPPPPESGPARAGTLCTPGSPRPEVRKSVMVWRQGPSLTPPVAAGCNPS